MSSKIILAKLYFGTSLPLGISWYWGLEVDGRTEVLMVGMRELCLKAESNVHREEKQCPRGTGQWGLQASLVSKTQVPVGGPQSLGITGTLQRSPTISHLEVAPNQWDSFWWPGLAPPLSS